MFMEGWYDIRKKSKARVYFICMGLKVMDMNNKTCITNFRNKTSVTDLNGYELIYLGKFKIQVKKKTNLFTGV